MWENLLFLSMEAIHPCCGLKGALLSIDFDARLFVEVDVQHFCCTTTLL